MELSADVLAQIQQALASGALVIPGEGARSPNRPRQLHDLRLLPTKDDPRPTFFWSAEAPRDNPDASRTYPYPRLLWAPDGTEITVHSRTEHESKVADGYVERAPDSVALDPMADMRAMLASLSPEDRELVLQGNKQARIQAAIEALAGFSDDEVQALSAEVQKRTKKSA